MRRSCHIIAVLIACLTGAIAGTAHGDVLVDESFTGPTATAPLRVGGTFTPCLTASTDTGQDNVPGCPTGQPSIPPGGDPAGAGTLRLTDNAHDRSGFAIYHHVLPFTSGIRFTFTTFAYNGTRVPGYGAADGISVFFTDGAEHTERPGAFGGSLGYAQKSMDFDALVPDLPGIPGGVFGVGIDEFGNFANDREARGYGCQRRADRTIHPNFITLRGPGEAGTDWLRGYCLEDRVEAPGALDAPDATSRAGIGHTFRIDVDPLGQSDGTPNPDAHVRVEADMNSDGSFVQLLDAPLGADPPETFEFGFAASTGGGTNIHEIRALRVETIVDLPHWTLAKSHPAPMVAGTTGTFHLQAALDPAGGVAYAPVTLTDRLPPGFTVAALPHGGAWDCADTVLGSDAVRCSYSASLHHPLRPGTQLPRLVVPVRLAPDAGGHVVNRAELTGAELVEPVQAEDPVDIRHAVDVGVAKTANPSRVATGGAIRFTLLVTNHGPGDARGVVVEDRLPPTLVPVTARSSGGACTIALVVVRCGLGTLAARTSAQVIVDATAAAVGTATDVATVTTTDADNNPDNDRASADVEVVGEEVTGTSEPALTVTKDAAPATARPGDEITYNIRVRNEGQGDARDVALTDTVSLPNTTRTAGASCDAPARTGAVTCRLGDLAPGETATVTERSRFVRAGSATNVVTVAPADTAPVHATVRVMGGAALALTKTADRSRLRVGERVRFRIVVRSLGPEPAGHIRVCDQLPQALERPSGGRRVCWSLPGLAAGASRSFTLRALAVAPAARPARNVATATGTNVALVSAVRSVVVGPAPEPSGLG